MLITWDTPHDKHFHYIFHSFYNHSGTLITLATYSTMSWHQSWINLELNLFLFHLIVRCLASFDLLNRYLMYLKLYQSFRSCLSTKTLYTKSHYVWYHVRIHSYNSNSIIWIPMFESQHIEGKNSLFQYKQLDTY